MSVRAKMNCYEIAEQQNQKQVKLRAVYGDTDENKTWSKYTPSGHVEMTITNPDAYGQFEVGKDYFVDFTPVE